jgi:uncharacterized damage-inducible protein DinB
LSLTSKISAELKRRVFDESYERIFICLDLLTEEQIWFSPKKSTNSIGNLILHLVGNARQWIIGSFGNIKISRNRSTEFVPGQNISKNELKIMLDDLKLEMLPIIDGLSKTDLNKAYNVQVYNEQGIGIIIHVIEHFSYHTGQIALLTKLIADKSLNFYDYPLE